MLLPLLNVSVPEIQVTPMIPITIALNFDLWVLLAHMIFELIHPPETLEASSGTSLSKTVVLSGTTLVGLEMAGKIGFPEEYLITIFNTALASCVSLGPRNSGWWFGIGPVLKDQSLWVVWFRRMQIAGGLSRFVLRQSLTAIHQQRHHGLCISLLAVSYCVACFWTNDLRLCWVPTPHHSFVIEVPHPKNVRKKKAPVTWIQSE